MKKILLLFSLCSLSTFSQQSFAPKGTEWYFGKTVFPSTNPDYKTYDYNLLQSVGDTLIQGKICNTIDHSRGRSACSFLQQKVNLYQSNDTVYYYIPEWQKFSPLYVFGAGKNDSWTIEHPQGNIQVLVDSTSMIHVLGQNLKVQYVTYKLYLSGGAEFKYQSSIIEHIGDIEYLFRFYIHELMTCSENGVAYTGLRCYSNPERGFYKTGATECNFTTENDYYPFPTDSNSKWNIKWTESEPGVSYRSTTFYYIIDGDTTFNGQVYHKLWIKSGGYSEYNGGIREKDKKVYYTDKSSGYYSNQEILLYDFSKQKGDTIIHNEHFQSIITNEDTIELAGEKRRRLTVTTVNGSDYWVEGIGSLTNGLLEHIMPIPTCACINSRELICFTEDNIVKYLNPKFNDCNPSNPDAIETTMASKINIYIDRQSRLIKIDNVQPEDGLILQLSDMTGKVIRRKSLKETNSTISIPNKSGYLLITVTDPNGKVIESIKIIN